MIAHGHIHVSARHAFTPLQVLDRYLDEVCAGTGSLDLDLPPGAYVVRAGVPGAEEDVEIAVDRGAELVLGDLAAALPPPLPGLDGPIANDPAAESRVVLLAQPGEDEAPPLIRDRDGTVLAVCEPAGDLAVGTAAVAPGLYVLEYEVAGLGRRAQPLLVADGFETQAFVAPTGHPGPRARVYTRPRGSGYDPAALESYVEVDAALDGLMRGRVVLSAAAREACERGEHPDPLLSLIAAWTLAHDPDFSPPSGLVERLLERLPHCTDVRLLADDGATYSEPPLLAMATERLMAQASADPNVLAPESWMASIAPRLRVGGPWTRWDPEVTDAEAEEAVERGVRTLSGEPGRSRAEMAQLLGLPRALVEEVRLSGRARLRAALGRADRLVGEAAGRLPDSVSEIPRALGRALTRYETGETGTRWRPAPPPDARAKGSCQKPGEVSSRARARDAGWPPDGEQWSPGGWEDRLARLRDRRWRDFSWLTARALLDSANDKIAKQINDVVNPERQRWTAAQRASGVLARFPDMVIRDHGEASRCLILGDPGEADASQYAVIDPMLNVDREAPTDFMVVLSDVIYPAGDVNDYVNGFYEAYCEYDRPILALPGNHDWYDGLNGFMYHFCGAEPLPPSIYRGSSYSTPERLARWLWRRASRPDRALLLGHRAARKDAHHTHQPGPYWALDMSGVRLVAIDTGIKGTLDREQGEWLLRMSEGGGPKVLLTGKPVWVNGKYHPCDIEWGRLGPPKSGMHTVDDIVRHRDFGYVAVIGGDVHNYQRLTVTVQDDPEADPRRIEYVTAGGSGAYMSATHVIGSLDDPPPARKDDRQPPASVRPIKDADFRCYPTRGDSLAYYARWFGERTLKAGVLAACAFVAAVGALLLWLGLDSRVGTESLAGVMAVAVAAAVAVPLFVWLLATRVHRVFPTGYRTVGVLIVVPAVGALAAAGLASLLDGWHWMWRVALLGVATMLLPLVLTIASYYAFAAEGQLKRDLLACAAATTAVAIHVLDPDDAGELVVALAACALVVALLLLLVARRRKRAAGLAAQTIKREPWLYVPLTVGAYGAVIGSAVWEFWDAWAIQVMVAAFLGLVLLGSFGLVALIVLGGRRALLDIATGPLDPDQALSYLHYRGITETLPREGDSTRFARVGDFDYRTARICDFLLPVRRGPRALLNALVTEIGNADTPPMFKSFLVLAVEEGQLVLESYGVTGWAEHERVVPREDCVRIPL